MESEEERVKRARVVEARARNISHNVRCTECGSQSIEDSQADIAILLRKLIRDEIQAGKTDKEIFKKLEDDYGETVLYAPRFDMQTAALWLSPVIVGGVAAGVWAYSKHRKNTNVHSNGTIHRGRDQVLDIGSCVHQQFIKWPGFKPLREELQSLSSPRPQLLHSFKQAQTQQSGVPCSTGVKTR